MNRRVRADNVTRHTHARQATITVPAGVTTNSLDAAGR
jgi:hypothetical protein